MEAQVSRSSPALLALAVLSGAMLCAGCRGASWPPAFDLRERDLFGPSHASDDAPAATDREAQTPARRDAGNAAASAVDVPGALRELDWVRAVSLPGQPAAKHHWRHAGLDAFLLRNEDARPDLSTLLADRNPIKAGNAAIVMARWQIGRPESRLKQTVRLSESDLLALEPAERPSLRTGAKERSLQVAAFRCAAAEALGEAPPRLALPALRELLDEHGRHELEARAVYQPEVHAELLGALARHVGANDEPRFRAALASPAAVVQIEALRVWARDGDGELPREAVELRLSDSPPVRAAALRTLAARRHPQAQEFLDRALNDADPAVRLAAVAALGELGTQTARAALRSIQGNRSEILRAAAVGALAAFGGDESLAEAAVDKSWQVRQAVADSLAALPRDAAAFQREASLLANDLVRDASAQVQQHAVEALASWPLEQAGPVLLVGMGSGNFQVRRQATTALAERWPAAAAFPVDGSESQRGAALTKLRAQFAADFGPYDEILAAAAEVEELAQLSAARLEELRTLLATLRDPRASDELRARAADALARFGPPLVLALEAIAAEQAGPLPAYLFSEVLPRVSPYFAALNQLNSDRLAERQAGASQLAKLVAESTGKPMPSLALNQLLRTLTAETDPLVWQAVMAAVAHDPRGAAAQLAYLAVASASVEVRRRAAEYLSEHADQRHVQVLLPLLDDPSPVVVIAAIRALGRQGRLDDPTPLLRLLGSRDWNLRLEAATSLARLEAAEGLASLESLAREANAEIRRRAAAAMGDVAEPALTAALIALLDDRSDVQAEALRSLPRCAGEDVCKLRTGAEPLLPDEQVRLWKQWFRARERLGSPANRPAG